MDDSLGNGQMRKGVLYMLPTPRGSQAARPACRGIPGLRCARWPPRGPEAEDPRATRKYLLGLCRRGVGRHHPAGPLQRRRRRRGEDDHRGRNSRRNGGTARPPDFPGRQVAPHDHRPRLPRRQVLALRPRPRHPGQSRALSWFFPRHARRHSRRALRLRREFQPLRRHDPLIGVGGVHTNQHRGGPCDDLRDATREPD